MLQVPRLQRCWTPIPTHAAIRTFLVITLTTFLYACESPVTTLQTTSISGDEFTATLAQEYRAFATYEAEDMVDWQDAEHFARKGLLAAQGIAVEPEPLGDWRLPIAERSNLDQARNRLAWVLSAGAPKEAPVTAAIAQSRFDCWIEQQEENWQEKDIAACRDGFYALLSELENLEGPRSARLTLVLFDFDSAEINEQGKFILKPLIQWARLAGARSVNIVGHTDSAGPETYNVNLSLRRALAARSAIVGLGASPDAVTFSGAGESMPQIVTQDGTREPRNRRAEITINLDEIPKVAVKSPKWGYSTLESRREDGRKS